MAGLTILPAARNDLIEIGDFIALDNPVRAKTLVGENGRLIIVEIGTRPGAFPARDEFAAGLRVGDRGRDLILFHVANDEVEIVRVLHWASDLTRILGSASEGMTR